MSILTSVLPTFDGVLAAPWSSLGSSPSSASCPSWVPAASLGLSAAPWAPRLAAPLSTQLFPDPAIDTRKHRGAHFPTFLLGLRLSFLELAHQGARPGGCNAPTCLLRALEPVGGSRKLSLGLWEVQGMMSEHTAPGSWGQDMGDCSSHLTCHLPGGLCLPLQVISLAFLWAILIKDSAAPHSYLPSLLWTLPPSQDRPFP